MELNLAKRIKKMFKEEGHNLSIFEIKNMTKIASDTDENIENMYALLKNDYLYVVHIILEDIGKTQLKYSITAQIIPKEDIC